MYHNSGVFYPLLAMTTDWRCDRRPQRKRRLWLRPTLRHCEGSGARPCSPCMLQELIDSPL